ncbi:MAG: hypothetical protein AAGJ46_20555 [Planctomycetota bacterium]
MADAGESPAARLECTSLGVLGDANGDETISLSDYTAWLQRRPRVRVVVLSELKR